MGLDAFVHCRCWLDGLVPDPPVEVCFDPDEGIVQKNDGDSFEAGLAFDEWCQRACAHPQMEIADERIGNWSTVRDFQDTLDHLGPDRFPTLAGALPWANGGSTTADQARVVLVELDRLEAATEVWPVIELIDADTRAVLNVRVARYDGIFSLSGRTRTRAGLDHDGTFFVEDDAGRSLFRTAEAFTQRLVHDLDAGSADMPPVVLEAPDGTSVVTAALTVYDPEGAPLPRRLRVVSVPMGVERHRWVIRALRTLMLASVRTGNPVHWC